MNIGDRLLSVLSGAKTTVRIAAPFIKLHALERTLGALSDDVDVICVTRWRPEDIASGVCDLEIFDLIKNRKRSVLLIHPHLHAKFFAADTSCLVGSANLSHTALGWRNPSNLELLIELNTSDHGLESWWSRLQGESIKATDAIRSALEHAAAELRASGKPIPRPEADEDSVEEETVWIPECPRWTGLWEVYTGDEDQLPKSALSSANSDLAVLALPPGLDRTSFEAAVKAAFRSSQIFWEITQLTQIGLSDDFAQALLVEKCGIRSKDTARRWQYIKQWLSDLYPDEFRVETGHEILIRGRTL